MKEKCCINYKFLCVSFLLKLFEHESSTYTYLLADLTTKEALIIDPVINTVERDAKLIQQLGLQLRYAGN